MKLLFYIIILESWQSSDFLFSADFLLGHWCNCICTGFSIVLIVQKVCRICEPLKTTFLKKRLGIYRSQFAPTLVQFFILFWWVKNECLWHSVRTPNRDMFFVLDEFWMNFEWTLNELWTNFERTLNDLWTNISRQKLYINHRHHTS